MDERTFQPGTMVPGTVYRVRRLIGAGGMGTVYDVEDVTIGKRYVLKTLHPQLGAREDLARRMQNEARTLARLNHPNIVEVFTAGVTADNLRLPYYVMERLNGQSLRVVLEKKGRLELGHAYHIAIDLLDALDHAHDKGVIHRDVKPDNIFLHRTPAGITLTKLLDFGIMSVLDGGTRETAGRFLGTLRYAAPEQLRGEKASPKSDVYSAALVVFELIAGRGPFDDEGDPVRISGAHLHKTPPPVSRFVQAPAELDALLLAAMAKDADMRPRDAFAFAASLRNLKRSHQATLAQELTENRSTQSAIVPPPSVQSSVPPRDTISALPPPRPAASSLRRTTEPAAPPTDRHEETLGPTATGSSDFDRSGATRSMADEPLVRASRPAGTISVTSRSGSPVEPFADTIPIASEPLRWPDEARVDRSVSPQVRSLSPAPMPRRLSSSAVAGALIAIVAIAGIGFVMGIGKRAASTWPLQGREATGPAAMPPHPVVSQSGEVMQTAAASASALGRLPMSTYSSAPEAHVVPAPTIAPPALEDTGPRQGSPQPPAAASTLPPAALAASTPKNAPSAATPAHARAVPTVLRPGPGF